MVLQSWTSPTVMQYSYFSVSSGFPLKKVHPFRNFLAVLPPPTYTKLGKNSFQIILWEDVETLNVTHLFGILIFTHSLFLYWKSSILVLLHSLVPFLLHLLMHKYLVLSTKCFVDITRKGGLFIRATL